MGQRRTGTLLKGFAWLFLAAGVLPTFTTEQLPAQEVTTLSIGVPWSPWLVYRESWTQKNIAAAPVIDHQTTIEPRCWSSAAAIIGAALLVISRIFRARATHTAPSTTTFNRQTTVLRC